MRTERFRRGIIFILLIFALVFSTAFIPTSVLASVVIDYPVGIIDVVQGQTFTLRHRLAWDDPANTGFYLVVIYWDYFADNSYYFTLDSVVAYFDNNGDNLPDPGAALIDNSVSTQDNGTRYALGVTNAVGDWRLGTFNVDITLRAAGPDGTPHENTDNHPIYYTIIQSLEAFPPAVATPDPVTVRVLLAVWRLIETWDCAVESPAQWQLIETWTGTVEAPAAWQLVKTWTGTIEAPPPWAGTAVFSLIDLYTVNVEKNLYLENGSKLVVKFYRYGGAFENENVIENFSPPWHVEENESARHPEGISVEKVRLDLTTDDTENVISTIATFTVTRNILIGLIIEKYLRWPFASPEEKNEMMKQFMDIYLQWPYAPT